MNNEEKTRLLKNFTNQFGETKGRVMFDEVIDNADKKLKSFKFDVTIEPSVDFDGVMVCAKLQASQQEYDGDGYQEAKHIAFGVSQEELTVEKIKELLTISVDSLFCEIFTGMNGDKK